MRADSQSTRIKLITVLLALLIFSACLSGIGSDPSDQGNDVVEPAPPVVKPGEEQPVLPEPTSTPEPTNTPEPLQADPEAEPAVPAIPDEPLNTRLLLPALKEVMLRPADLITEYAMQNDREVDNNRVISQSYWMNGREYIDVTDRVTGWNTYMERVKNEFTPFSFRTRLEVFETIQGAQTAFSSDWLFIFNDPSIEITEFLSTECDYGHQCVLAYHEENIPGTDDFNVEYHLIFRYRNVSVYVFSKGAEGTVSEATVYEIADLIINRLELFE